MTQPTNAPASRARTELVAFGLAAFVTIGVLLGLDGLAANGYHGAQQIAAAQTVQTTQPG